METNGAELLRQEYCRRRGRNASYSVRSFARDLKLNPGTLCAYMNGKRPLSQTKLIEISDRLSWSPEQIHILLDGNSSETTQKVLSEQDHYQIIAEWQHYAIFSLMECDEFKSDINWIADRLGISSMQVEVSLKRLERAGLIVMDESGIKKAEDFSLRTTEDVVSNALRRSHEEALEIARTKLFELSVNERDFSSITFAGSKEHILELKKVIREFRNQMAKTTRKFKKDQVFQMSIQLFPLSTPESVSP